MDYPPPPPLPPMESTPYSRLANALMFTPPPPLPPAPALPPAPTIVDILPPPAPLEPVGTISKQLHEMIPQIQGHLTASVSVDPAAGKPRINVRGKGQRGEREVVKLLQAVVDVIRMRLGQPPIVIQRNQLQSHLGGEDLTGLDGFAVEVKFQETLVIPAWWKQACDQAALKDAVPILFYRVTRSKWTVMFRAYVETPGGNDSIEMDVTTTADEFVSWFGNAYAESLGPK